MLPSTAAGIMDIGAIPSATSVSVGGDREIETYDFEQYAPGAPQGLSWEKYHVNSDALNWDEVACHSGFGMRRIWRAPTAYIIFCSQNRERIRVANPGASFGEMGTLLGREWNQLNAAAKMVCLLVIVRDMSYHSCCKPRHTSIQMQS
jgi:hypothetical protein